MASCIWTACEDSVATLLGGGSLGAPAVGVYAGSTRQLRLPQSMLARG